MPDSVDETESGVNEFDEETVARIEAEQKAKRLMVDTAENNYILVQRGGFTINHFHVYLVGDKSKVSHVVLGANVSDIPPIRLFEEIDRVFDLESLEEGVRVNGYVREALVVLEEEN